MARARCIVEQVQELFDALERRTSGGLWADVSALLLPAAGAAAARQRTPPAGGREPIAARLARAADAVRMFRSVEHL